MNIKINKKDDVILKILHYFITEEDYKPVIINGLQNEIWLENMQNDLKLIRINTNYIHNEEQLKNDMHKASSIMKSIKKSTLSLNMTMLNLLLDTGESVKVFEAKNIETIKINKLNDFKRNKTVLEFFPKVKEAIMNDKVDPVEFFKLSEDMNEKTIKNEKKLAKIFSPKKPVITYALMAINITIFLYLLIFDTTGNITNMFVNNYEKVQAGEIYRLITAMFMHGGIIHLLFNMYALYTLGPQVERYYGSKRFIFIYFLSGIMGSIFSCLFLKSGASSLGSSTAIFGLLGSITYFTYYYRATIQGFLNGPIVPALITNLIVGLMFTNVGIMGHIGGFIGGLLVAMAIGIGDKGRKTDQINGIIVYILMAASLLYMVLIK